MAHDESAGLLLYRWRRDDLEVLLAHPGGPFWIRKDTGAWTIPKGLIDHGEQPLDAARREFAEETGIDPPGTLLPLGSVRQKAGKIVHAWAAEGDADPTKLRSNLVTPASGAQQFAEIDRYGWFETEEAKHKLNPAQAELVDRLIKALQRQSESRAS